MSTFTSVALRGRQFLAVNSIRVVSVILAVLFTTLVGCGSDRDGTPLVQGSNGVASLSGDAVVGETLSASISDSDGVQSGTESYQWFSDGDLISGATSSSYTLSQDEGGESVTVVIRYTDDSGLRETVESAPVDIQAAFALGALYVHGLVDAALCEISAVDSNGVAANTALASGTTSSGLASFGALVPIDGTALISCNGGTYVDEATASVLDAPATRAVVFVDGDATFTVSPLTEIATQLAEAAGDLNTAISAYNAAVGISFGVSGDISEIEPTNLATTAAINDDAGRYATALALISQVDANAADASAADIINNFSVDLADGTLSQSSLDDFNAAVVDLGTSAVAGNLNSEALLVVESAINNAPEPAVFEGLSATIPNDQATSLAGIVTVTDVNFGDDKVVAQTDVPTTYGMFSIDENGAWTYTLDTANATVAGLEVGESVNDTIALSSVDGTTANLVIRITALTQVAEITNTTNGDTGELRRDLDPHLLQGKLSFSFLKTDALADDGNQKDAYITLYGSSGSSSESLVDLRIQSDRFLVRNTDNAAYPGGIIEAPFTPNEWYEIEIIWDMSQANQITILINGEALGGGAFSTAAVVDSDFIDLDQWFSEGVERVQWRFGDNGTTIPFGSLFVDNVLIYSDTAGTALQFWDDFESYFVGDSFAGFPEYSGSVDAVVEVYDAGALVESVPAAFFNLAASIDSDSTDILMGMVTVIDPDPGEDMLVGQSMAAVYGAFSILPSGAWEYMLDTTNPTIAALLKGDNETETITVTSIDGTTAELVITIRGTIETNTGSDLAARIADRATDDAGELRYKPGSAVVTGRMTATVLREAGAKAESPNEDAQIAIYGSSTSSSNAMAYITLDISGDDFDLRDSSGSSGGGSTAGFVEDQEFNIEIAWDASSATVDVAPLVTITIDGQVAFSGADFASPSADLASVAGGVETVQFRVGGTADVTAFGFIVDDFKLYSSDSGSEVEVFSDDFESYTVGNSLDPDAATAGTAPIAGAVSEPATPYNNNSFDVFVVDTASELAARIADRATDDAGELRYKPGSAVVTGRMTATVLREAGAKAESPNEDAQIAIYGSSTSSSNAMAYVTLDISGDDFDLRDSSGSSGGGSTAGFVEDQEFNIEIAWDASSATVDVAPLVTITIDGQVAFSGADFASPSADLASVAGGVETVQFRVGGTADVTAFGFIVDDFKLYSSDSGSEVEVFSDDFESYTVGNSLDPDAATAGTAPIAGAVSEPATPYNNNSFDVFVVETGAAAAGGLGTSGNQFSRTADRATDDAGELRYKLAAGILNGRMTAQVLREAGAKAESPNEDAQIAIYGSSTSTSAAMAYITLDISGDDYDLRDSSGSSGGGSEAGFAEDQIIDFEIAWDASAANNIDAPLVTVTIDGQVAFGGQFSSKSTDLAAVQNGLEVLQFRVGGTADVTAFGLIVDDFVVYSSDSGSEVEVFRDDFESYTVGNSLDPDADTAGTAPIAGAIPDPATPYDSSSFDVFVGEE